jgi:ADP-ribosylglycohydrolase
LLCRTLFVKERFRCHKLLFDDLVFEIACGLHNFKLSIAGAKTKGTASDDTEIAAYMMDRLERNLGNPTYTFAGNGTSDKTR